MKLFTSTQYFSYPWDYVSAANWNKYPNEVSSHVVAVDVLRREFDCQKGLLTTERLITCKQPIPSWLKYIVGGADKSYVREVSVVDRTNKTLIMRSVNLTFATILRVYETVTYSPNDLDPENSTKFYQVAEISSNAGFKRVCDKVEEWAVERFGQNASKGKMGFDSVLKKLGNFNENLTDTLSGLTIKTNELLDDVNDKTSLMLKEINDKTILILKEINENTHDALSEINECKVFKDINGVTINVLKDMNDKTSVFLKDLNEKTQVVLNDVNEKTSVLLDEVKSTCVVKDVNEKTSSVLAHVNDKTSEVIYEVNDKTNRILTEVNSKTNEILKEINLKTSELLKTVKPNVNDNSTANDNDNDNDNNILNVSDTNNDTPIDDVAQSRPGYFACLVHRITSMFSNH